MKLPDKAESDRQSEIYGLFDDSAPPVCDVCREPIVLADCLFAFTTQELMLIHRAGLSGRNCSEKGWRAYDHLNLTSGACYMGWPDEAPGPVGNVYPGPKTTLGTLMAILEKPADRVRVLKVYDTQGKSESRT